MWCFLAGYLARGYISPCLSLFLILTDECDHAVFDQIPPFTLFMWRIHTLVCICRGWIVVQNLIDSCLSFWLSVFHAFVLIVQERNMVIAVVFKSFPCIMIITLTSIICIVNNVCCLEMNSCQCVLHVYIYTILSFLLTAIYRPVCHIILHSYLKLEWQIDFTVCMWP